MKARPLSHQKIIPMLAHETLYVGIDIGKQTHVAGFLSTTLLARYQRFENCPALSFENSREGFRSLIDRVMTYVPPTQVYTVMEVTGHYHLLLLQYLQEVDIPVYLLHVQERARGLMKTDKRDALSLANLLFNQLEKGIQVGDPLQAIRRLVPPTEAASQLRGMVQRRQELTTESTRRKNKLIAICDEVFPEFTRILKDPNSVTALAFRKRFPTPMAIATASRTELHEARGKTRMLTDAKLGEFQRLAEQSIGTHNPVRLRGLVFEQEQLIEELELIERHLEKLEAEMTRIVFASREGKILLSIQGIGPIQAALIIARIGNIANFERSTQLKSYFGWAPTFKQSSKTLDRAKLTPRGVRMMKHTMYLAAWHGIQREESEWAKIYHCLVPRKCNFDERTQSYRGRGKVIGRIAGQMTSVIFTLLKRDQEMLAKLPPGAIPPDPMLYDPSIHQQHRSGQYQPASQREKPRKLIQFPSQ